MIFYFSNKQTGDVNIFAFQSFDELKDLVSKYGEVKLIDPGDEKMFLRLEVDTVAKEESVSS